MGMGPPWAHKCQPITTPTGGVAADCPNAGPERGAANERRWTCDIYSNINLIFDFGGQSGKNRLDFDSANLI